MARRNATCAKPGARSKRQRDYGRALHVGDDRVHDGFELLHLLGVLRDLLPERLASYTANTVTDRKELLDELALVTERGWAVADEELEVGMVAIAVPVRDHTGGVIAALSISGPRYRLDPADAPTIAASLADAVAELSAKFGYTGP